MIDVQYMEFIDNFTRDLKYVLLCMIDLIKTEEEKEQLRFENIINTLLEDHQKYFSLIFSPQEYIKILLFLMFLQIL